MPSARDRSRASPATATACNPARAPAVLASVYRALAEAEETARTAEPDQEELRPCEHLVVARRAEPPAAGRCLP
ncbi:hypothetical protein ACR820_34955 [Streptomyces netropsis]